MKRNKENIGETLICWWKCITCGAAYKYNIYQPTFMNRLQFLDASLHFWSSQSENVMPASVLDQRLCSCVCTNRSGGRRKGTLREGLSDKYSVFRTTGDQQSHVRRSSTTVSTMSFGANFWSINCLKHKNYTMTITMIMIRNCDNVHTMFNFYLNSHNKKNMFISSHLFCIYLQI